MKPLSKNEMVALKRSKGLIKKRKFGWMYAPDKLEMWLEEMEEQGYNLYRVSRMGTTFLFAKGSPQQVAYRADYQNNLTNSYYELHKDAGWELLYTSNQLLNKWSIWAYPYEQEESVPQIYSDKTQLIKHAKRVAITHLSLFIPVIIMYLSLIMMEIFYSSRNEMYSYNWFTFIISGILIIEFGTFSLRSWLYYRRIKKG